MSDRVIANFAHAIAVRTNEQSIIRCLTHRRVGLIVCGDYVKWSKQADGSNIIDSILPRSTVLSRPDRRGHLKALAANLDQLIIVIAPQPETDWLMVSAYLVYARLNNLDACIILNKTDLLSPDNKNEILSNINIYESAGFKTVLISCKNKKGIRGCSELFVKKTSILVGQSGVGKSSILNMLLPDQNIQTNAISEATGLGSHTTTTTILYTLQNGGELIDSPGVRQFDIGYLKSNSIQEGFIEFDDYRGQCQFSDCSHTHEPNCAIINAVKNNEISEFRWLHYQELMQRSK